MRPRVFLGLCLVRFLGKIPLYLGEKLYKIGVFIQSLAVVVMKPNDLISYSQYEYSKFESVKDWGDDRLEKGLLPSEKELLVRLPVEKGRLLLLGIGGGREAIPLAKMGFEVTGVDFVPNLVEKAIENATQQGLKIEGIVQDISKLDLPSESFDLAWLSIDMYSFIPTRQRRVEMLRRINSVIKERGYFICQFQWVI